MWWGKCAGGAKILPKKIPADFSAKVAQGLKANPNDVRFMSWPHNLYETNVASAEKAQVGDFKPVDGSNYSTSSYDIGRLENGVCCPPGSTWALAKTSTSPGEGHVNCCSGPVPLWKDARDTYLNTCRSGGWLSRKGPNHMGKGKTYAEATRDAQQLDSETFAPYAADSEAAHEIDAAAALEFGVEGEDGPAALLEDEGAGAGAFGSADDSAAADRHAAPLL
eukprot:tig00000113_g5644.t1